MKRFLSIVLVLCLAFSACACSKPAPKEDLNLAKLKEYAANPNYKLEIQQTQITEKDGPEKTVYHEVALVNGNSYVSDIESDFIEDTMLLKTECFEQDGKLIQINFGNFIPTLMSDEMEFVDDMQFVSGFYANLNDPATITALLAYEAPSQLQAMINDGIITENSEGKIATSFDTAEITTTPDTLVVKLVEDYSADDYTFVYTALYTFSDFGNAKPEISADAKSHASDAKEYNEYMKKAEMVGNLMGEYIDSVSGRATLMVLQGISSDLVMEVSWADSAFETYYWKMSCDIDVDNLTLNYTDCESYVVKVDANGNETSRTIYNNGKGFFSLYGDVIKWNGAEEPSCQNCEFEMM